MNETNIFTPSTNNGGNDTFFAEWVAFFQQHPHCEIEISNRADLTEIKVEIGYEGDQIPIKKEALECLFSQEHIKETCKKLTIVETFFKDIPDNVSSLIHLEKLVFYKRNVIELFVIQQDIENGISKFQSNYNLEDVFFKSVYIESLEGIGQLTNLKKITVDDCSLKELTKEFYSLDLLEEIQISDNRLEDFSSDIWKLNHCKSINFSENFLYEIPEVREDNHTLETLILSKNEVGKFPNSITKLKALKTLLLDENEFGITNISQPVIRYLTEQFINDPNSNLNMGHGLYDRNTWYPQYYSDFLLNDYPNYIRRRNGLSSLSGPQAIHPSTSTSTTTSTTTSPQHILDLSYFENQEYLYTEDTPQFDYLLGNIIDDMRLHQVESSEGYVASSNSEVAIMNNVIQETEKLDIKDANDTIDVNQMGYYAIDNENIPIDDFMYTPDNIVIRLNDSYYLTKRSDIATVYKNSIFYKCFTAGNTSQFLMDSNIDLEAPLFDFNKLGIPLQYFYQINVDLLLFLTSRYYIVKEYIPDVNQGQTTLASTISKAVYDGTTGGISANHCGTGQGGKVYQILPTVANYQPRTMVENVAKPNTTSLRKPWNIFNFSTWRTHRKASAQPIREFQVNVMVKNTPQTYPINDATTVAFLIQMIVNQYNEQVSDPVRRIQESQVKLLFSGKYLQNDQVVSQIPGYERGVSTILSVIRNPSGGTKKRRHKKNKKTIKKKGKYKKTKTQRKGRKKRGSNKTKGKR
jgi:hypothetical protein